MMIEAELTILSIIGDISINVTQRDLSAKTAVPLGAIIAWNNIKKEKTGMR